MRCASRSRSTACRSTLVDTAGLRESRRRGRAPRHGAHAARARARRRRAGRVEEAGGPRRRCTPFAAGRTRILVYNKIDLAPRFERPQGALAVRRRPAQGLEELRAAILARGRLVRDAASRCFSRASAICARSKRRAAISRPRARARPLGALRRGTAARARRAGHDHRRIHRGRPARRDLRPLLHRQVRAARDSWVNPALALLLCAAVGAAFAGLRMPLPWMIGPLLAMAACNFAGAELRSPPGARLSGRSSLEPRSGCISPRWWAREVSAHWWLLIAAGWSPFFSAARRLGSQPRLRRRRENRVLRQRPRRRRGDGASSGERLRPRRSIALAQSLRVLIVVIAVPFAMTYSGAHGADTYAQVAVALRWQGLATLLAVGRWRPCCSPGCACRTPFSSGRSRRRSRSR